MNWTKITGDENSLPSKNVSWCWITVEHDLGGIIGKVRGVVAGGLCRLGKRKFWVDMSGASIKSKVISWTPIEDIPSSDLT